MPIYNQAVKRRQLAGRFAECLDGITTQLGAAGYSGQVVSQYECALVHLALWCKRRSILPAAFNDAAVARSCNMRADAIAGRRESVAHGARHGVEQRHVS